VPAAGPPAGVPAATGRPLYVLPIANAGGRAGAVYQTRLEIASHAPTENRVRLELIAGGSDGRPLRKILILKPGQTLSWVNAADELFSFGGAGALRVLPRFGPVVVKSLTANVAAGAPPGPLLDALTEADAIHAGDHARLSGLVHDPEPGAAVRTNIGFLNLSPVAIVVRVSPYGPGTQPLGHLEQRLRPGQFAQIDDVFAKVKAARVNKGSAVVQTSSQGGAFLAYASVIRGPIAPVVYVFPDRQPPQGDAPHD
jgi:hypothetical protein